MEQRYLYIYPGSEVSVVQACLLPAFNILENTVNVTKHKVLKLAEGTQFPHRGAVNFNLCFDSLEFPHSFLTVEKLGLPSSLLLGLGLMILQ